MSATLSGNDLTTFVEQPNSGEYHLTAEGILTVTRIWKATYPVAVAGAPTVRSADPGGTNALCTDVSITRFPPNWGMVTATYQGFLYLPFTVYEFSNSRMERPISMHPDFTNNSIFPDDAKAFSIPDNTVTTKKVFEKFLDASAVDINNKFAGIESFIVGNAQWRKTSYAIHPDFDQTDVGKLSAPEAGALTGLPDQANAAKKWLKVEKTCRNMLRGASLIWEIGEVWQFNALGWLPEIYS